jgi:hypothetical protein
LFHVVKSALRQAEPIVGNPAGAPLADVTMLRVALAPDQVPFSVRLSQLLNEAAQMTGVGVEVGIPQG